MSIEKLSHDSKINHEKIPYTQVCNNVINNIKDSDSFLVWCYLLSKTSNWKVIKQDIKNKYGFGDKKLKRIFSYLHRANLLRYAQSTCANGTFAQTDAQILNGSKFDINQPFISNAPVVQETGRAVNGTGGFDELLKKDLTKQTIKQNKDKNICATENVAPTRFDDFWAVYPRKKDKKRAHAIWVKANLGNQADEIMKNVRERLLNDITWKNDQYIPHPSTYLKFERWKDEVTLKSVKTENKFNAIEYAIDQVIKTQESRIREFHHD